MAGATTQAERQAQVLAAGYNGPLTDAAINQAYANAASPADLSSSGLSLTPQIQATSPGLATPPTSPTANTPGTDLNALRSFFAQSAGFSREQLAESQRQFNATLDWQKQMWQQQGLPQLEIQQRLAQLEDEKFRADLQLAQSQQGFQYLQAASQMGGPADYFQQQDFLRGARQRGDVPVFLNALSQNTQLPTFQGSGTTPPVAQSAPGLAMQLGAGQTVTIPTTPGGQPATSGMQFQYGPLGTQGPGAVGSAAPAGGAALPLNDGVSLTGYNPQTGELGFQYQFNTDKKRAVFGLFDNTTGQFVADPSNAQIGATPGNGGVARAGDWMTCPYCSGASGTGALKLGQPLDPSHSYSVRVADAVGGGGFGNEVPFSGAQALSLASPQPTAAAAPTPVAAPTAAVAPAAAPTSLGIPAPAANTTVGGYNPDQALAQIGSIFKAGPTSLAPGTLERLDPNELALLQSGATKLGYDYNSWLRAYQKAGVGQTASAAA